MDFKKLKLYSKRKSDKAQYTHTQVPSAFIVKYVCCANDVTVTAPSEMHSPFCFFSLPPSPSLYLTSPPPSLHHASSLTSKLLGFIAGSLVWCQRLGQTGNRQRQRREKECGRDKRHGTNSNKERQRQTETQVQMLIDWEIGNKRYKYREINTLAQIQREWEGGRETHTHKHRHWDKRQRLDLPGRAICWACFWALRNCCMRACCTRACRLAWLAAIHSVATVNVIVVFTIVCVCVYTWGLATLGPASLPGWLQYTVLQQ